MHRNGHPPDLKKEIHMLRDRDRRLWIIQIDLLAKQDDIFRLPAKPKVTKKEWRRSVKTVTK
jgi:hypothetical protein